MKKIKNISIKIVFKFFFFFFYTTSSTNLFVSKMPTFLVTFYNCIDCFTLTPWVLLPIFLYITSLSVDFHYLKLSLHFALSLSQSTLLFHIDPPSQNLSPLTQSPSISLPLWPIIPTFPISLSQEWILIILLNTYAISL